MTNIETGIFDAENPPSPDLIADCVHCGFCLPACPTYVLWQKEMDSPRGRIHLMRLGLENTAEFSDGFVRHIDTCLGCMACVTACPSGVQYDRLIEATRPQVERHNVRSTTDRLFRRLIFLLFPHPKRLRCAAFILWIYQTLGLQRLLRASGLLNILPERLRAMEAVAPPITLRSVWETPAAHIPATGTSRRRVGLLLGCVQRVFFSNVNIATARVLAAEGCDVIAPPSQGCCGALMLHAGFERKATAMARGLIDAFDKVDVDTVAINAAGCGSTLKEYGYLLRNDPEYADRAAAFSAKCHDVSEILAELEPQAKRHPLPIRVAYHDACHLQHAQGIKVQPRQVLASVPELDVCEIPEGGLCCGSAGIYNLVEPDAARALGERKAQNVVTTCADAIVSSNPGCLLQLQSCLASNGQYFPAFHLVEIIDASIRGVSLMNKKGDG